MLNEERGAQHKFLSSRATQLVNFVLQEINQYKAGLVPTLTPNSELATKFGYTRSHSVSRSIARVPELLTTRAQIFRETASITLSPSRDLAWMIGYIAGRGSTLGPPHGLLKMSVEDPSNQQLLDIIKTTGEKLFKVNGEQKDLGTRKNDTSLKGVIFYGDAIPPLLGDLRRPFWASTVRAKHNWILEDPEYNWGLLEGYCDARGEVIALPLETPREQWPRVRIGFHTEYTDCASLIREQLRFAGVGNPRIDKDRTTIEGIRGVSVTNYPDAKLIAANIHSHIPDKEQRLQYLRELVVTRVPVRVTSPEELIKEWFRLEEVLGHPPSSTKLRELQKNKLTPYHPQSYKARFGPESFSQVRQSMVEINFGRGVNETLKQYEDQTGTQVRYVPKMHYRREREQRTALAQWVKID